MVTRGAPREPQKHQNRVKMTSRAGFKKRDGKSCGKVHFPESWICNPYTPVQSKHTFSISRFGLKSDPKSLPKAPQNRLKIITKRLSSLSRIHAEKADTQNAKNAKKYRKMLTKNDLVFRIGSVSKITKISDFFKMGPQASKMSPRASKITQNHENLVTQNQENPRKQT